MEESSLIWDALWHLSHSCGIGRWDTEFLQVHLASRCSEARHFYGFFYASLHTGSRCQCLGNWIEPWGFTPYSQRCLESGTWKTDVSFLRSYSIDSGCTMKLSKNVSFVPNQMPYGNKMFVLSKHTMQSVYRRIAPFKRSNELMVQLVTSKKKLHAIISWAISFHRWSSLSSTWESSAHSW